MLETVFSETRPIQACRPRGQCESPAVRHTQQHTNEQQSDASPLPEWLCGRGDCPNACTPHLAGLMMRSMIAVQRVAIVCPPDHTLMMRVPLAPKR